MRNLSFLLVLLCLAPLSNFAQLATGSIAPDFSITDINGVTHDLYDDYLDQGKAVILDLSGTWCPPCWTFHNNGILEDLYDDYGPNSSEYYAIPIMIEVDPGTNMDCFFGPAGCNDFTLGDWSGHPYPLCNPASAQASSINNDYDVIFLPTIYLIAPSGYTQLAPSSLNTTYSQFESWVAQSYQMENSTWTVIENECGLAEIDFETFEGHGTVTYNWSNGATTEDLSGLVTGDYSVTLTDSNSYTVEFGPISVVGEEEMAEDNFTLTDIACFGAATGEIAISITGGSGNYTYEWSNGSEDGPTLSGLIADNYEVTVTDADTECDLVLDYELVEPDQLEVELMVTDAGCGGVSGELEINIIGGVGPYEIVIDGITYSSNTISLTPGSYTANILDNNNCSVSENFSITTLPLPNASSSVSGVIDCADLSVTLSSAGSSSGSEFNYAWYNDNGNFLSSGTSYEANQPGTYTLYVTNTNSNCTSSSEVSVINNAIIPTAIITPQGNLTCNNTTINLSSSGSSSGPDISYRWSDDNGGNIVGPNSTEVITIDSGGDYILKVEDDSNSCENTVQITITEATRPRLSISGSSAFCEGESSQFCVNLAANQSIQWSQNGSILSATNCLNIINAGNYTATLTDNTTGCSSTESFSTIVNTLPSSDIQGSSDFCDGGSTVLCHQNQVDIDYNWSLDGQPIANASCITLNQSGEIQLIASNNLTGCATSQTLQVNAQASPNAQLSTPNGTIVDCNTENVFLDLETEANTTVTWTNEQGSIIANTEDITVTAGNYFYVVQSSLGCQTNGSITITADTDLPELILSTSEVLTCAITETILSFNTTSSNYTLVWFDAFGNMLNGTNPTVDSPGLYLAQLTDANGCKIQEGITVSQDLTRPMVNIIEPKMLDCNTESVTLQLEGDIDGNSIDWINDQGMSLGNSASITVNSAGAYTSIVTAPNGCSMETSVIVLANTELPQINILTPEILGCNTPQVVLEVRGELSGNTINWTNEQGEIIGTNSTLIVTNPGNYKAQVRTPSGCQSTISTQVIRSEVTIVDAAFTFSVNTNAVQLNNVSVTSGITAYLWELGDGNTSDQESLNYEYQEPGEYEVCLTTSNECGSTTSCETVLIKAALSFDATIQDISCHGGTDGRIIITVLGGSPMYTYEWSDSSISGMGSGGLSAGDYEIIVTDADGSSITIDITLTEPEPIVTEATITETSMVSANGQISLDITGGTAPYSIMWDDGSEETERAGLEQGTYMAVITDDNGCQVVSTFTVTGSTAITEITNLNHFNLSPNPASNEVSVQAEFSEALKLDVSLINARGEKLYKEKAETDLYTNQLDLTAYPSGIYLLELRSGQQVSYRKLVITK